MKTLRTPVRLAIMVTLLLAPPAACLHAGSTEPELAVTDATTSVEDGVITVEVLTNFEYGNYTRLGYPIEVVLTQGTTEARLNLDGTVTVAVGGGAPTPDSGALGVIAIERESLTVVLPGAIATGGTSATLQLEATFDDTTLSSNAVGVAW